MNSQSGLLSVRDRVRERTVLRNVYIWMTAGLLMTAAAAAWVVRSPAAQRVIFGSSFVFFGLIIGEVILVIVLFRKIMTMSVTGAVLGFAGYSLLNGLTLSAVLLAYTKTSVAQAFFICAGTFAAMSLWALTTKRDLSGWGHFLMMGLVGLIITGLVGLFFGGETFSLLFSAAGVILFTLLTAYDTQAIKRMSDQAGGQVAEDDFMRLSILGALKLYLDFINLFLFMLRFLGRRR